MEVILIIWIIGILIHLMLAIGVTPIREVKKELESNDPIIRSSMRREILIVAINIIAWPISWACEIVRDITIFIKRGGN